MHQAAGTPPMPRFTTGYVPRKGDCFSPPPLALPLRRCELPPLSRLIRRRLFQTYQNFLGQKSRVVVLRDATASQRLSPKTMQRHFSPRQKCSRLFPSTEHAQRKRRGMRILNTHFRWVFPLAYGNGISVGISVISVISVLDLFINVA